MKRKPYGLAKRGRSLKIDSLKIGDSFLEEPWTMLQANGFVQGFRFRCDNQKRFRCAPEGDGVRIWRII